MKMTEENDKLVKSLLVSQKHVQHKIYFTHSSNVIDITHSFNVIDISSRNPSKVSKKLKTDSK